MGSVARGNDHPPRQPAPPTKHRNPCDTTPPAATTTTPTATTVYVTRSHHESPARAGWDSLTDSELKVVSLIAEGVTNRSVATQLHLSLHTVKTHIRNAFAKLGINSRAELTRFVRQA